MGSWTGGDWGMRRVLGIFGNNVIINVIIITATHV